MLGARAVVVLGALGWSLLPAATAAAPSAWQWPLAGPQEVSRPFAPPATRFGAGHRGVDLPGEPGAVVRAAGGGRITYAGLLAGRGVVVVVHGGLRTTYEPVTSLHPVGTPVAAGEPIGRLEPGHVGCAAPACLHWGLKRGEQYLDPTRLVHRGPVRLLPVAGPVAGAAPPSDPSIGAGVRRLPPSEQVREGVVDQPTGSGTRPEPPPEVAEPAWSLRVAEAPLGMAAVAALVLGIGLLVRPRPLPPSPVSGGMATSAAPAAPQQDEASGPPAALLDLDEARARRQVAS